MTTGRPPTSPARVAAFGYHEVCDEPLSSGFPRPGAVQFTVSRRMFAEHLDCLAGAATRPGLVTGVDFAHRGSHVLLTFDDGGKSALYAAEALQRHGWSGHFFVITGRIGERTFLTTEEVRELHALGHHVGSHSHSHPDIFREQTVSQMLEEWRVSADRLSQLLGQPCISAAVPGGHISPAVLRSAHLAGLRYLFTCDPSPVPQRVGSCWVLGRCLVKRGTPASAIGALANFRGWGRALLTRRAKDALRRALPSLFRLYLRRRTRESTRIV